MKRGDGDLNGQRGFCREFGLIVPEGAATGIAQVARYLADEHSGLPQLIRGSMRLMLEEIGLLEALIGQVECELSELAYSGSYS